MNSSISYKGYIIDIHETKDDYRYVIKKDDKIVLESANGFPFPSEAETQAKLLVNRLNKTEEGWMIS
jgi:hypothetical protein